MAFGIGTNTQDADAGEVRGEQREVACECWFTSKGRIIPRMLKVQEEDRIRPRNRWKGSLRDIRRNHRCLQYRQCLR